MMKTSSLFLAIGLALSAAVQAQAPSGNSTEEQIYQQRRNDVRSALSVSTRPGDGTAGATLGPRKLSLDERKELRQQLRQQYRQPSKVKP